MGEFINIVSGWYGLVGDSLLAVSLRRNKVVRLDKKALDDGIIYFF